MIETLVICACFFSIGQSAVNPITQGMTFDPAVNANLSVLNFDAKIETKNQFFAKLFDIDTPAPVHKIKMIAEGDNNFSVLHNIHDFGGLYCIDDTLPVNQPEGIVFDITKLVAGKLPLEYLSCYQSFWTYQPLAVNEVYSLPDNMGMLLGGPNNKRLNVVQHFMARPEVLGKHHSWRINMWHTNRLRPKSIGLVGTGPLINQFGMIIPPRSNSFTINGFCEYRCFEKYRPEGVEIMAVNPHYHKSGINLKVRHIRDGQELPPIVEDSSYFMRQKKIYLDSPRKFQKGDTLIIECTYNNSMNDRAIPSMTGSSIDEEMCMPAIFYHPFIFENKTPSWVCQSALTQSTMERVMNVKIEDYDTLTPKIAGDGRLLKDYMVTAEAAAKFHPDSQKILLESDQISTCSLMWPIKDKMLVGYNSLFNKTAGETVC